MAYPAYLRARARELRIEHTLSLDEIAERLALPKTTVYYWIKDLPLGRAPRWSAGLRSPGQWKGSTAMQAKYRKLREEAYARGVVEYDDFVQRPTFRDFVVLYIAEGYKRSRNTASICNSDSAIVALGWRWMRELSGRLPALRVQHHEDQDAGELRTFWSGVVGIAADAVVLHPKSNSGQLRGRSWRCVHGVAAVSVHDTLLRSRLQAWMDRIHEAWQ